MSNTDGIDPPHMSDGEYIQRLEADVKRLQADMQSPFGSPSSFERALYVHAIKTISELRADNKRLLDANKQLAFMVDHGLGPDDMSRE